MRTVLWFPLSFLTPSLEPPGASAFRPFLGPGMLSSLFLLASPCTGREGVSSRLLLTPLLLRHLLSLAGPLLDSGVRVPVQPFSSNQKPDSLGITFSALWKDVGFPLHLLPASLPTLFPVLEWLQPHSRAHIRSEPELRRVLWAGMLFTRLPGQGEAWPLPRGDGMEVCRTQRHHPQPRSTAVFSLLSPL